MKRIVAGLAFAVLSVTACGPSEEKKAEALQEEVMALHDSAMAHMGALYNSRKSLAQMRDTLTAVDSLGRQELSAGVSALEQADEQMMQWMRQYKAPDLQKPEEALPYLQQEKVKIEKVQADIEQSLQNAHKLRAQYKTK